MAKSFKPLTIEDATRIDAYVSDDLRALLTYEARKDFLRRQRWAKLLSEGEWPCDIRKMEEREKVARNNG